MFGSLVWDGKAPGEALLEELPKHTKFHKGDTIVTSGYSAVFPEGIPVGVVLGNEAAAAVAALGAQVDKVVRNLDHIQIVLNDQHRIAPIHQLLQNLNQLVDIRRVQARGRLVQNIDGPAGGNSGQLRGQLDPLGLAPGEGGHPFAV